MEPGHPVIRFSSKQFCLAYSRLHQITIDSKCNRWWQFQYEITFSLLGCFLSFLTTIVTLKGQIQYELMQRKVFERILSAIIDFHLFY